MAQRRPLRLFLLAAFVAATGAGIWLWTRPRPIEVLVREADRGVVEATVANTRAGTVRACRRARLAPQASGRVARLPVERGDRVRRGDLLLELWNEDLEARRRLTESEHNAARARAEQGCLAADFAAREAARIGRLAADGIVDAATVDRASNEAEGQAAACRAARAAVAEASARIAAAREELVKTVLRAPFDGIVAEVSTELGEMVSPSPPGIPTPPAIDLIEEGCLYVVAPIDEVDAPRVQPGRPARVRIDAFPERSFEGTVRKVAPYVLDVEKQARTVDVEVGIDDPSSIPGLVPGYSADVEILLDRETDVVRVPTEAVFDDRKVLVLEYDRLIERTIEPGIANWEYTAVRSGIEPGDRVVISLDREGVAPGAYAVPQSSAGG